MGGSVQPSDDWNNLLEDCDFDMAAGEIRGMLDINRREAAARGEEVIVRNDLGDALRRFLGYPSMETAISLLEAAPSLYSSFEVCKTSGPFYETRRLFHAGEEPPPSHAPSGTEPTYDELLDRLAGLSAEEPDPPTEIAQFLSHQGWKPGEPPSHHALHAKRWCDPLAPERWFVWQSAFGIQRERIRRGISSSPLTSPRIEQLLQSGHLPPRIANELRKLSEPPSLTQAFRESARPEAPPPTGWWFWPVFGIAAGLMLLSVSTSAGAICLVVMGTLLGAGMIRATRNRR